jgi:uncharacterized membrane protein
MKRSMKNSFISLFIVLSLSSCYYDKKEILYPSENTTCDTSNITFSLKVQPILDKRCSSCHGAGVYQSLGGGINLDGYTNADNYASPNGSIIKTISGDPSVPLMPPTGKISDCEISQIQKWVNAGAPNN